MEREALKTMIQECEPLGKREDGTLWHVYYGTRGAAGAYVDALQKCLLQNQFRSFVFVSCSYRFPTPGVRRVFFPITDRSEKRNKALFALRGCELLLAYAFILCAAAFARPIINLNLIDDYPATSWFVRICKAMRLKVFITCHDVHPHDSEISQTRIKLLQDADRLIVHSCDAQRQLTSLLGNQALSRIRMCAFPFSSYDQLPTQSKSRDTSAVQYSASPGYFLFVGVVRLSKGIDILIDAWANRPAGSTANLIIAGKWPVQLADLKKVAEALPGCVVIDKYLTDQELSSFIRDAGWVILPYKRYTHSSILFSCMNSDTPVITSDCELFREALSGYPLMFSEGKSAELERVLARAAEPGLRPQCSLRLHEIHQQHLNNLTTTVCAAFC